MGLCAVVAVALIGIFITACPPPPAPLPPDLAGSVEITGIARVGETLRVNLRNLDGSGNVSFEWKADGFPFENNRNATLPLTERHAGFAITVTVNTSDNLGSVTSLPVTAVEGAAPALTGSVSIIGDPRVGHTLRVNVDNLGGSGAIFYEWKLNDQPFANNQRMILPLGGLDVGSEVTVTVRREHNSGSVTSESVGPVVVGNEHVPPLTGSVGIVGRPHVWQTLRVNSNLSGSGEVFYEWRAGGATIGTGPTLFLIPEDVGRSVTVTVIRENGFGYITSQPVPITLLPRLEGTVSIAGIPQDGIPRVGQDLIANTANLRGSGAMSFVWRAGDVQVGTTNRLILTNDHVGQRITVTVSRANNDGSVTSPATQPVEIVPPLGGVISITGTPQVGHTLGVNTIGLDGTGHMSFVWRLMGGAQIGTGSLLTLQSWHVGQFVTVTVTTSGNTGSIMSLPVGPVIAAATPPPPPPPPPQPTDITITVTGIPWQYINRWGAIDFELVAGGGFHVVAESPWIRIPGSSATFTMRTLDGQPFNMPGNYRIHFSIDDDWGPVGDYSIITNISAGSNSIPFGSFIPVFHTFSEDPESTTEEAPPGGVRTRTRR